jgi:hypothetical protein
MNLTFLLKIVIGAVVLLLVSARLVGVVVRRVAPWSIVTPPEGVSPEKWQEIVTGNALAARWLGTLEGLLAYGSFLVFDKNGALVIGGYLAFKVASKWESWQNIVQVPQTLEGVPQLDFLRARRQWGTTLYLRFLIGTLLNLLFGFVAAALVKGLGSLAM